MKVGQYYKNYLARTRELVKVLGSMGGKALVVLKQAEKSANAAQENIRTPPKPKANQQELNKKKVNII